MRVRGASVESPTRTHFIYLGPHSSHFTRDGDRDFALRARAEQSGDSVRTLRIRTSIEIPTPVLARGPL